MPKRQRQRDDEGNLLLVITCRCMLCSESEAAAEEEAAAAKAEAAPAEGANMAASIAASIALAKNLQAAEETGILERQAQDAADAKIAIAWHKIEYVFLTLTSTSLSLSSSLCRNPDFDEAALAEQYRLASPGKIR